MPRTVVPDNNTAEITVEGDNTSPLIVGKGNKGAITIKGDNCSSIRIGEGNKGEICIEKNNAKKGTIKIGDGNTGEIKVDESNDGIIDIGDNNQTTVCIEGDNTGQIIVGDGNQDDVTVEGDNDGSIVVGDDNEADVCITGDNKRAICVGDNNEGDIKVEGVNKGAIKVGEGNCGELQVGGSNEGTISSGENDLGRIGVGGEQNGTVEQGGCSPCREFFDEYDKRFLPGTPPKPLQGEVQRLVDGAVLRTANGILLRRYRARRRGASGATPAPAIPAPNALDKRAARLLSEAQKKLFEENFKQADGELNLTCIQNCYVAFANGELRDPETPDAQGVRPGEPDGDFFFLFAEFALLAIECDFDKDFWTGVLTSFVKAQEVFVEVYPPVVALGGRRAFRGPAISKERKEELHEEYDGKDLEELVACYRDNLKRAEDQPLVAFRMLTPRERVGGTGLLAALQPLSESFRWLAEDPQGDLDRRESWGRALRFTQAAQTIAQSVFGQPKTLSYLGASTVARGVDPAELPVVFLEGISGKLEKALGMANIRTLSDLAAIQPAEEKIEGISRERLEQFRDMARIKLARPELMEEEVELIVKGLGLRTPEDIDGAKSRIGRREILDASKRIRLPDGFEPLQIERLFEAPS